MGGSSYGNVNLRNGLQIINNNHMSIYGNIANESNVSILGGNNDASVYFDPASIGDVPIGFMAGGVQETNMLNSVAGWEYHWQDTAWEKLLGRATFLSENPVGFPSGDNYIRIFTNSDIPYPFFDDFEDFQGLFPNLTLRGWRLMDTPPSMILFDTTTILNDTQRAVNSPVNNPSRPEFDDFYYALMGYRVNFDLAGGTGSVYPVPEYEVYVANENIPAIVFPEAAGMMNAAGDRFVGWQLNGAGARLAPGAAIPAVTGDVTYVAEYMDIMVRREITATGVIDYYDNINAAFAENVIADYVIMRDGANDIAINWGVLMIQGATVTILPGVTFTLNSGDNNGRIGISSSTINNTGTIVFNTTDSTSILEFSNTNIVGVTDSVVIFNGDNVIDEIGGVNVWLTNFYDASGTLITAYDPALHKGTYHWDNLLGGWRLQ
jgi:hypothetical protein